MKSSIKVTDDILIVAAYGELDHHTAGKLRDDIDEAMTAFHCRNLIFNLEHVTFMDSSGIGVVLGRYNKVLKKGGKLYLAGCSEYIEKILHMAGVFSIIEKKDDVDEALWLLQGQQQMQLEVSQ